MPQSQSLSTPPRDLACLKADALYKLWNAPKHSLPPTFPCRIVIFYLTSIHFVQNCHLPPYIHPLLRSDGRFDLFVHYTTAGRKGLRLCAELSSSTSCPFHNCRKAGAGDGGEVHSSSRSSQWRPRRMLPPKPGPRNPKCLLLHLVCLFLPCLPSSFFGFFMVWSFSDHVVSSVLYISW